LRRVVFSSSNALAKRARSRAVDAPVTFARREGVFRTTPLDVDGVAKRMDDVYVES